MDLSSQNDNGISLSSLLKASQRLSSMTSIRGKIYSIKGNFFIFSEKILRSKGNNVFENIDWEETKSEVKDKEIQFSKREEDKPKTVWRQEGGLAKFVISLNLVLNIYVLQIYIDKKPKFNFYINYDLSFDCKKSSELGLEKFLDDELLYHWKSIINPDTEYELIVLFVDNEFNLGS